METNHQLSFLQEKIEKIGTAIFFNESESVVKLPTNVVYNLRVDEYGYVWFATQKPFEEMKEFETEFPVRLELFRKGISYYMQVEGKGWVVTDPEEILHLGEVAEEMKNLEKKDWVLVKVKIFKAEYYESSFEKIPAWKNSLQMFYSLFVSNYQYRTKNSFFSAS